MQQPSGHEQNADQIAYWNGPSGQRWADRHAVQESLLGPIADVLIDRARPKPGERVLDVGCGGGVLSEPLARLGAAVTGLDPAPTNVAIAKRHAERAGLAIDYRKDTVESVVARGERLA